MERVDGFKHIQLMSNVSPLVYWFGTVMYDVGFFLFVTVIRILVYKLITHTPFLGFDLSLGKLSFIIR